MRILMVAAEAVPFAKTGGLADVAGALPAALARLGHEVTLVTPRCGEARPSGVALGTLAVPIEGRAELATVEEVPVSPGARAVLLGHEGFFNRPAPYGTGGTDYPDNPRRFGWLCRAALEWAAQADWPVHVLHAHDWHAALAMVYAALQATGGDRGVSAATARVLTIHNLAYQGVCDPGWIRPLGLPPAVLDNGSLEFWGRLNLLKGGILHADAVTTVSPRYAAEVPHPELGCGLDGVLASRRDVLTGIVNGIDTEVWDPLRDPLLPARYGPDDLAGKAACKRAALEAFGLPADAAALARPLVVMISRLVEAKGHGLLELLGAELVEVPATFVVMGEGEVRFERFWRELAIRSPDRVALHAGYDEPRAHLLQGGGDIFLLPSRYEPCGLSQLYAQRYGTVPVVHATGGLDDTVEQADPVGGAGTGVKFRPFTPAALLDALRYAVTLFAQPGTWQRLQAHGMTRDFSWERSAEAYAEVYARALARRGVGRAV
jgi:starch synthase